MESHVQTTPTTHPQTSSWRVDALVLHWADQYLRIIVRSDDGRVIDHAYSGAQATTLMIALNKANLTTNSLHKRALNQLVADGILPAGAIAGAPD
jgi:hypothetical protein